MVGATSQVQAAELLRELPNLLIRETGFDECVTSLKQRHGATFDSVWGSSCALLASALETRFDHVLIICSDPKIQDNLLDDLETFSQHRPVRFPAYMIGADSTVTVDFEYGQRLKVLKDCMDGNVPAMMVATAPSLLQPVPTAGEIRDHSRKLACGEQVDIREFQEWLLTHGFHKTTAVELPGEFSVRGGIIDVFAPDWQTPIRIELFDDEIESLRYFQVGTQRSNTDITQIEITVIDPNAVCQGDLAEYLPDNTLVLLVELEELVERSKNFLRRVTEVKNFFSWHQVQQQLARMMNATVSRIATGHLGARWQLPIETVEKFRGDAGEIRQQVDLVTGTGQMHVVTRVEGEVPRVTEILAESVAVKAKRLSISVGSVHEGFRFRGGDQEQSNQVVVSADQLFHRTDLRRSRGKKQLGKAIDSFLDLRDGDLVVHLSHGISRFRGLKMLEKEDQLTEHLELEFHGGTKIYVPASKIDLVQKYVGGTKTTPILSRIGGKAWVRQKEVAQQAVTDLAAEMLELQAARESRNGIALGEDTLWQQEFEHSFPYTETPDQLTAIETVKEDMQSARPMDRLLCGDVGFGKTEVAMRAAFKAVENGYQVAMLVPTTVLAEQHYRSFKERMMEFPLDIVKLSRFASRKQIKESIEKLKSGQADIAIGTHRIVSKDVSFYNLGLVIIDEEQRFGVAHKERLKSFRQSVDILTMSATPIPRTLHMSLVGVRDISNLETPPSERLAVETKVTRFDENLVKNAIRRELDRGGQVFFVHNRVIGINTVKERLQALVPEAKICVGHGQMPENQLERVMTEFIEGKHDVLLATTIIESGLDIRNANTIFIDHADQFGLSDLHQLRGRVGRDKYRGYCYLLLEPQKSITPIAAKRLQAIETYSEMGAGFAIAMRDLEIRGAGNLLGTEQSGHIAAIGYELYCQLLETAVRKLKKQPAKLSLDIDIDLPLAAYFPDEYVPDRRQKIDLYRRLTRLQQFDQIQEFETELLDRFGPMPGPVKRLLKVCQLKLEAAVWQITAVFIEDKFLGFRYQDRGRMEQLAKANKGIIRIVDDATAYISLKSTVIKPNKMLALVKSILQRGS